MFHVSCTFSYCFLVNLLRILPLNPHTAMCYLGELWHFKGRKKLQIIESFICLQDTWTVQNRVLNIALFPAGYNSVILLKILPKAWWKVKIFSSKEIQVIFVTIHLLKGNYFFFKFFLDTKSFIYLTYICKKFCKKYVSGRHNSRLMK